MNEKKHARQSNDRQIFRTNLEAFPNVVNFFGISTLKESFNPRLRKQKKCLLQYFSASQPVTLRYLDDALAEIGSLPDFGAKAKELAKLETNEGFAQFNSVLIELWFAAQFARGKLPINCEPKTHGDHKAEFKVTTNEGDVYFEVRNIELPERVKLGVITGKHEPRSRLTELKDIIRQSFYLLLYPYHVILQPENLSINRDKASFA